MNPGKTLLALTEGLPAAQALFPEGIALEGQAAPGAGALCFTGEKARSEDIAGNVTRTLGYRLWAACPALDEAARGAALAQCEALRTALEAAALPDGCDRLTAGCGRCGAVSPGGEGGLFMELELTVTERMD